MEINGTRVRSELMIVVVQSPIFKIVAWTYTIANNTAKGTGKEAESTLGTPPPEIGLALIG